jgi:hypothetical protein
MPTNNPWPFPNRASTTLGSPVTSPDPAEDAAFQAWVDATRPSGDAEAVHRDWLRSDARWEFVAKKRAAAIQAAQPDKEAIAARIYSDAFRTEPLATKLVHLPFEYKLVEAPSPSPPDEITALLNREGAKGWVLGGCSYGCFILMRPKGL